VTAGAKNYAYTTDSGYTDCTVKGLTIGYLVNMIVTFELIKRIVIAANPTRGTAAFYENVAIPQHKFTRNKNDFSIRTGVTSKNYRYVFDKRVVQEDKTSLPFGY
jgi:tRNA U38,U39,U40 pseudouridine synthase TruA